MQEIYIIDDDESSLPIFRELFKDEEGFKFIGVKTEQIDIALKNIPSLIIINEDAIDIDVVDVCKKIRTDEDNRITPIIVVSSNTDKTHRIYVLRESVEYYIKKPVDADYLYYTVKNLNRLLIMNRRISALTGLPGNVQIHAELKKRIANKEEFSVLYLDLDNFKAYNDVYGFLKGDQIIEYTANVILKCIHEQFNENYFVAGDAFPISSNALVDRKNTNCEKAGVKQIRLHDFRHSCASLLINKGANIQVVAKYLGHTKIEETLKTYSHLFISTLDEIINVIDTLDK